MMDDNSCMHVETLVLSGMCSNNKNLCYGVESLKVGDFSCLETQVLFSSLQDLYKSGSHPGLEKTIMHVKQKGLLEAIGGVARVSEMLGMYVPDQEDLEDYVGMLKDSSLKREIKEVLNRLTILCESSSKLHANDLLSRFKEINNSLEETQSGKLARSFDEGREEFIEGLKKRAHEEEPEDKLTTGIHSLDSIVGGMAGGKLITVAARPGMGKTVFSVNIALSLAKLSLPVYFFSIEMGYDEIEERIYSQLSGVEQERIRIGKVSDAEIEDISKSSECIGKNSLFIDDKAGIKIGEIVSKSKRAKEVYNIQAVFIDYLQLIDSKDKPEYRHLEIANYTRALKTLAKDLNIPVFCLAQLSRKVEERSDHKPLMSDLKESGAIEQDSDLVIAINRRDAYDEHDRPGEAQIFVLKNRHGTTGNVRVRFDKERSRFQEIENG